MKILNFGSINVDIVFSVNHIVHPAETISARGMSVNPGGKGANQSVALARAGATVLHAGQVGKDTEWMIQHLKKNGIDTRHVMVSQDTNGGQAIIQVDQSGQNSIIVFGGANQAIPESLIGQALADMAPGDWLVLQNEINLTGKLITAAHASGLKVCLNPSPITPDLLNAPLEQVDLFILNEIEGAALAEMPETSTATTLLDGLAKRFPQAAICLTLGADGSCYHEPNTPMLRQAAFPAEAVDTTAAGDTFSGYFLTSLINGKTPAQALETASRAAAITVSRPGALDSIPFYNEL